MTTDISTTDTSASPFKTFPEFSKLTLADYEKYRRVTDQFPTVADTKFYSLMFHWSARDIKIASSLNDNLILSYWVAGIDEYSGLSVIGDNRVDATFTEIFDFLRNKGDEPKLVHVPEFVIESLEYPELFNFESERSFDEYILSIDKLCNIDGMSGLKRRRIRRFVRSLKNTDDAIVCPLDLGDIETRVLLKSKVELWKSRGLINNLSRHINETIDFAIDSGKYMGIQCLALYAGEEIQGYILYHSVDEKSTMILTHAIVNDEYPCTYDYMVFAFAKWFLKQGISRVNLDSDLGLPLLRAVKMALRPDNFLRKYTVRPV